MATPAVSPPAAAPLPTFDEEMKQGLALEEFHAVPSRMPAAGLRTKQQLTSDNATMDHDMAAHDTRHAPASSPTLNTPQPSPSPSPSSSPKADDSTRINPFGDPLTRPYAGEESETVKVRWVYRAVNFLTELFFGVDKDLDHLPEKRRSILPQTKTGAEALCPTPSLLPPSISAGYGELSWQGMDKLLYWMSREAPDFARLGPTSRFLDIGSGFGKCVIHAKLRAKVARSVGIECIKTRHEKALEAVHLLRAGFVPGLSDAKDAPNFEEVRDLDLEGCELFEGDISLPKFHPLVFAATHIYAFDVVFSKETHAKILPIVEASNFQLFGCYLNPQKLAQFGCKQFHLLHTIKVHTTGKQSFTCYFYMKKEGTSSSDVVVSPLHRNTRLNDFNPESDEFWQQMHEDTKQPEAYIAEAQAALAEKASGKKPAPPAAVATPSKKKSMKKSSTSSSSSKKSARASSASPVRSRKTDGKASGGKRVMDDAQRLVFSLAAKKRERVKAEARKRKSMDSSNGTASASTPASTASSTPAAPAVKQLTRNQEFELAMALAMAPKPKVPRRTNNSLVVRMDPLKLEEVPKHLAHYLADPTRPPQELVPEGLDQVTAGQTPAAAGTKASKDDQPTKKQKVATDATTSARSQKKNA